MNGSRGYFDSPRRTHQVTARNGKTGETYELNYTNVRPIGNGSFGVVIQVNILPSRTDAAIKKVLQDRRFKNRELQIMKMVTHPNIVELKAYFLTNGERSDEVYLNLVLEYVPETLYKITRNYARARQSVPMIYVKLYMYQLFRSLAYIHSMGICHRDIKPQNLLIDPSTGILKLCDFGSAKQLVAGEPNVSYICSRYYRAPELIFGATHYTTSIDIWSAGCVMAELMLGQPLFPGDSGIDQLVEIIKVLGAPSREQVRAMNPNYVDQSFPPINPHPLSQVFSGTRANRESLDLLSHLLVYKPKDRYTAFEAMAHPFFDELRKPETRLPDGHPLPPLFNFTPAELSQRPELNEKIIPQHAQPELRSRGIDLAAFTPPNSSSSTRAH